MEQGRIALGQQAGVLDDVRRRAGVLTVLVSGVATFLGSAALTRPVEPDWLNLIALLPLVAFGAGLWVSVSVLLPTRHKEGALEFAASPEAILDLNGLGVSDIQRSVALGFEAMWDQNKPVIDGFLARLTAAGYLLLLQVVLWSLVLMTKEMV